MSTLLQAMGLNVVLGSNHILTDIDLDVHAGALTTLIGPNGAGKSTLFGALSGDLAPTRGQVLLRERPVRSYPPKELALLRSVLPQDHLVRFSYSVEEIVHLARLSHRTGPDEDEQIVTESLASAEMLGMRRRDVQTLSGGEMARTAFARTLAQTTPIVLLDEPTAALDLRHQEVVLRHARRLRDEGACVVVVIHDLNLASAYSDRVVMLAQGAIAADGPPMDVLTADRIGEVYRQKVMVTDHPTRQCPMVVTID